MRRGYEAVALMGLVCVLLAISEPSVDITLYGPQFLSAGLFAAAGIACLSVAAAPDARLTRVGSGMLVSLAFAWRAVAAVVTDLTGGGRPLFAVILYCGLSLYISLTWHRVLPAPVAVREKIREWAGEP